MAEAVAIWQEALPIIRNGVTGVGVWAALNSCVPVAYDENVFVLGFAADTGELSGHLKIPSTKRLIETTISKLLAVPVTARLIEGTTVGDWEHTKRRDVERRRLQENELTKMRAEMSAKTSWDSVYEQLSRRYAAVNNKSMPQNRARFFEEAVAIVAEARQGMSTYDEQGERNFARCLERIAQYTDIPSAIVGMYVLQRAGEI